ncbi:TPR end-of-group domain-containing protein [Hyalangium minutum]|uniref:Lipoprotein n=1 Tax=Hyalangium minutum TaxID=394096 RepID=A0A085WPF9_9BACT|nr:hypothetical protein [Hyalangium minutum]KFE69572.1 hypothetical protein DB31_6547 [Hyalangium minutum]
MRQLFSCLLFLTMACATAPATPSTSSSTTANASGPSLPFMEPPAAPPPGTQLIRRADKLMEEKAHEQALALYQQAWDAGDKRENVAYSAACASALIGRKSEAMTWLERSVELGFRDVAWMKQDTDLSSIHGEPAFAALLARIPTLPVPVKNEGSNPELIQIGEDDQQDRRGNGLGPDDWKKVSERDRQRRQRVTELLAAGAAKTGADFLAAALVFQHGDTLEDFAKARELAAEAARKGHPMGLWLTAAAWDRWLMKAEQPQRFGTQYTLDKATKQMRLYPVDPSVKDAERERWGFPPLAEIPQSL